MELQLWFAGKALPTRSTTRYYGIWLIRRIAPTTLAYTSVGPTAYLRATLTARLRGYARVYFPRAYGTQYILREPTVCFSTHAIRYPISIRGSLYRHSSHLLIRAYGTYTFPWHFLRPPTDDICLSVLGTGTRHAPTVPTAPLDQYQQPTPRPTAYGIPVSSTRSTSPPATRI